MMLRKLLFIHLSTLLLSAPSIGQAAQLTFRSKCEVANLGAPTSGPLIEGSVGSINRGSSRHLHYNSESIPMSYLGPAEIAKRTNLKDQPGLFPTPLDGEDTISFQFSCQDEKFSFFPVIVRPDGTVYQGLSMNGSNAPQTLVISSPAQAGIYTLFALREGEDTSTPLITVEAKTSTQPKHRSELYLRSFNFSDQHADVISAEFFYTPSS